jgi:hypothetical protein
MDAEDIIQKKMEERPNHLSLMGNIPNIEKYEIRQTAMKRGKET